MERLGTDLAARSEELARVREELENVREARDISLERASEADGQLRTAREEVQAGQAECERLGAELAASKSEVEAARAELEAARSAPSDSSDTEDADALRAELDEITIERDRSVAALESIGASLAEAHGERVRLEEAVVLARNRIAELEQTPAGGSGGADLGPAREAFGPLQAAVATHRGKVGESRSTWNGIQAKVATAVRDLLIFVQRHPEASPTVNPLLLELEQILTSGASIVTEHERAVSAEEAAVSTMREVLDH